MLGTLLLVSEEEEKFKSVITSKAEVFESEYLEIHKLQYPLECNPGTLVFIIGFWLRFYLSLNNIGLYSRWGSINQFNSK